MKSIPDILRLKDFQIQQFFCWGTGQQLIFFRCKGRHPMSGLAGNGHSHTPFFDHLSHFFQKHSCTVQIHLQNGFHRSLAGRDSGSIYQHGNFSIFLSLCYKFFNGLSGRKVHFHSLCVKSCLLHDLCSSLGVLYLLVPDKDFHSMAHSPCNSHTDLTCSC